MTWDYSIVAPSLPSRQVFRRGKATFREEGLLLEILTDQAGIIGVLCHIEVGVQPEETRPEITCRIVLLQI